MANFEELANELISPLQRLQTAPKERRDVLRTMFDAEVDRMVALLNKEEAFSKCSTSREELLKILEDILEGKSVDEWFGLEPARCKLRMVDGEEALVDLPAEATGGSLRQAAKERFRKPVTLYFKGHRLLDDQPLPQEVQDGEALVDVVASAPPEEFIALWKEADMIELVSQFKHLEAKGWRTTAAYHQLVVETHQRAFATLDKKRSGTIVDRNVITGLVDTIEDARSKTTPEEAVEFFLDELPDMGVVTRSGSAINQDVGADGEALMAPEATAQMASIRQATNEAFAQTVNDLVVHGDETPEQRKELLVALTVVRLFRERDLQEGAADEIAAVQQTVDDEQRFQEDLQAARRGLVRRQRRNQAERQG